MRTIWIWLVVGGMLLMLFGCSTDEPADGSRIVNTDKNAPKVIVSKDIKEFSAYFYLEYHLQAGDDDYSGTYDITIKDGMLSWSGPITMCERVDDTLLEGVQEIIDKYELVKRNGKDEYTSGLPYEYQPCGVKVVYESGEVLTFREDNDPRADWWKDLFVLLRQYCIDKGHDELKPSKEARTIVRFELMFNEDAVSYEYFEVTDADEVKLCKTVYHFDTKEAQNFVVDVPEGFYDTVSELIRESDIARFHTGQIASSPSDLPQTENGYYGIYIDYENGHQIYGSSTEPKQIEEFNNAIAPLKEYLERVFQ